MKAKSNSSDEVKIKFGNDVQELKPFDVGINFFIGYRLPSGIFFSLNFANSMNNPAASCEVSNTNTLKQSQLI